MEDKTDRESVLVQLRRERGLTAGGDYRLPLINLNQLMLQSGADHRLRPAAAVRRAVGAVAAFVGTLMFDGKPVHALLAALFCGTRAALSWCCASCAAAGRRNSARNFPTPSTSSCARLRAGHPVPIAINMVARELPDPIGSEFGTVTDEITYGADLETAMRNLYFRVGTDDLPLFVTAVAIQGSTGGNLGEILRKSVGGHPPALQDAPQDPRARRRRPRLGDDPVVAADRHVLRCI